MTQLTVGHYIYELLLNLANNPGPFGAYSPSQNTQNFVVAWAHRATGGTATSFNLLNNPGAPSQGYPDAATGLKATVDTLNNGSYGALVNALKTNDETSLGFTARNGPTFQYMIAKNIAQDLSLWISGHNDLNETSEIEILDIMHDAGISNPTIEGGNAPYPSEAGESQATINQWASETLQGDASSVGPPGPNPGGTGTPGGGLSGWDQASILKVAGGVLLVLVAVAIFIKVQVPGSPIAKFIPGGRKI